MIKQNETEEKLLSALKEVRKLLLERMPKGSMIKATRRLREALIQEYDVKSPSDLFCS